MPRPKRTNFEVAPDPRGGWRGGQVGAKAHLWNARKVDIVREMIVVARASAPSSLRIKGRDGKFQEERSYGTDPRQTPG